MTRISALALTTAVALSLPLAAQAQVGVQIGGETGIGVEVGGENGVGVGVGGEAGVNAQVGQNTGVTVNAQTSAETEIGHSEGDVLTAIEGSASVDFSAITDSTEINIVSIATVSGGDADEMSLAEAQTTFESEISALRSNISGNATLTAALEAEGHSADDVVAVWTEADGSVTVFVTD